MLISDTTPLNDSTDNVFLLFGEIDKSGIEYIYKIEGLGSALANKSGLYFLCNLGDWIKNVGELKSLYKFKTGLNLNFREK
jgi:hypothetical protein